MAPNRTWSSNGGGNLFLEADPDAIPAPAGSPPIADIRRPRPTSRGRGLIVPVGASSLSMGATTHRPDAAAFTRPTTRLGGGLQKRTREHLRRADANARRLVAQLAARPYAALIALAMVGATLLALSWMGLALRTDAMARHYADHRAAAATTALQQEQSRAATTIRQERTQIATLYGQLERANAARRTPADASPAAHSSAPGNGTSGKAHGH
ncbi:MAG: hypothetical protein JO168_18405 [Solirubrobacterales bacterium]|nr:hypothetical protein [Solirubrobacterales bacterium]